MARLTPQMPRYIIKVADKYMEYSSVVDAVVSMPMTKEEFTTYYLERSPLKPEGALKELEERLVRVEQKGASCMHDSSAEDTLRCNRMDEDSTRMAIEEDGEEYRDLEIPYAEFVEHVKNLTGPFAED